ncbi:hypothetical protein Pcinc_032482 [Petrolisthes cinctipes]|uniref:PiggyBac transposable element-derived protein domain-containing protein n=1 Tax=Petrolisthes cinctipes TaxID=88211 RepID=A0AAE1EU10_PETCI|nr:hypothetical protein Pcinc_032482 [Petrolisthes cinctipes]
MWSGGSDFVPDSPAFDMTDDGIQPAFPVHAGQYYVDYFLAFMDDGVVQRICDETNRYQEQCAPEGLGPVGSQKMKYWVKVTIQEMYIFLALMLLMPHVRRHDLEDYWSLNDIILTIVFGKYMSRD